MDNCRQIRLLTWNSLIGQFVKPVGGKGDGVNGVDGEGIIILARCKFYFIGEHGNLFF